MDYIGIENVNEYYTQHYLSAMMGDELDREVFSQWRERAQQQDPGFEPPDRALRDLWQRFFKVRDLLTTRGERQEQQQATAGAARQPSQDTEDDGTDEEEDTGEPEAD